jgi:hypothetical protein
MPLNFHHSRLILARMGGSREAPPYPDSGGMWLYQPLKIGQLLSQVHHGLPQTAKHVDQSGAGIDIIADKNIIISF